jgi:peptidoglycan/LPS O-acetylase OafA/YrhL
MPIDPARPRRAHDSGLEGLRGVAAFFVGISHVYWANLLNGPIRIPPLAKCLEAGHAGVLVFFMLSGYVISWTNEVEFSQLAVKGYARRRWLRLAPIYYVAFLLTLLAIRISGVLEPFRVLVGAFFCLQNFNGYFSVPINPPMVNGPLWSLNYEVLYYGLFILLWRARPSLAWVFVPALLAGILGWIAPSVMPLFISSYCCGWLFWAGGWWLAKRPQSPDPSKDSEPLLSWTLLIFSCHHIAGLTRAMNLLGLYSNDAGMVTFGDIALVPSILLVLSSLTRRTIPGKRWIEAAAWLVCAVPVAGMVATGRLKGNPEWVAGAGALVAAALLFKVRSTMWLKPFAWFGGISYAFYVIHFPLLYILGAWRLEVPPAAAFLLRLAAWIALCLGGSWLLERRFQPWIRQKLAGSQRQAQGK